MSDGFDDLDATEKAGIGAALNRRRALAAKIANELRNKRPEHFVDKLSLADIHVTPVRVWGHEIALNLSTPLTAPRLRALHRAEDIGSALKGGARSAKAASRRFPAPPARTRADACHGDLVPAGRARPAIPAVRW